MNGTRAGAQVLESRLRRPLPCLALPLPLRDNGEAPSHAPGPLEKAVFRCWVPVPRGGGGGGLHYECHHCHSGRKLPTPRWASPTSEHLRSHSSSPRFWRNKILPPPTHTHPVKATEKAQRSLGWTALKKNHTQDHPTNSPYPRSTQPLPDMPTAGKADLRGTHLSPSAGCRSRSREQD